MDSVYPGRGIISKKNRNHPHLPHQMESHGLKESLEHQSGLLESLTLNNLPPPKTNTHQNTTKSKTHNNDYIS
jgi:hypothetical protein